MNATASSPKSTRAPTPTSNTELGPSHEPSSFMEHFSTLDAGGCRMGSETRLAIPHDGPPRAALTATVELAKKRPRGRTGASSRRIRVAPRKGPGATPPPDHRWDCREVRRPRRSAR
jgi:hypothetical protein